MATTYWLLLLKGLGHAASLCTESVLSVFEHVNFLLFSVVSCMSHCAYRLHVFDSHYHAIDPHLHIRINSAY